MAKAKSAQKEPEKIPELGVYKICGCDFRFKGETIKEGETVKLTAQEYHRENTKIKLEYVKEVTNG